MRFAVKDGVALVTGAAHGIGACLALELARRGCHLALCDMREEALEAIAARARESGVRVSTHALDVADASAVLALPAAVLASHGAVNLLINNAGVALLGTFEQVSLEDFEWLVNINLWGVIRTTKAFLPLLKAAPRAHVVNISSVFGLVAPAGQVAYCVSKFGVRGFSEALRHELAGRAIGVTCVHPGGVRTEIANHARLAPGLDPALVANGRRRFSQLARTTPQAAAVQIVDAVQRGTPRLLIGSDARFMDRVQRLMPTGYWRVLGRMLAPKPGPSAPVKPPAKIS
jgi:short-subunit dehydrogenase